MTTRQHTRGAAIITALLTVALVSVICSAMISKYGINIESLSGRHDQAQAKILALGATDWARNILADDKRTSRLDVDYLGEAWATKIPPTPVSEGEIGGEIQDYSGRFNINNLINVEGKIAPAYLTAFIKLLSTIGMPPAEAYTTGTRLADWLDRDQINAKQTSAEGFAHPHNANLIHIDELKAFPELSSIWFERLNPFILAASSPSEINLNTASAEVLTAINPNLRLSDAQIIIAQRQRATYNDKKDFEAKTNLTIPAGIAASAKSRYFLATGRARFGVSVINLEVFLDRENQWPIILWQRIL